jgi:hypothetical protein
MGFLLALGALGFGAWLLAGDRYPPGHGPLDTLPPGVGKASGTPTKVTAPTTKIVYKTWTFPPVGDQQFHVAARDDGKLGWVSYWVTRSTGARKWFAGWTPADGDQVALLKKDFGL